MEINTEGNNSDQFKFLSFCTVKERIHKVKRQLSELEQIKQQTTAQELISHVYKQLMQLNTRKINNPTKKWVKELNRHFSREHIQMANECRAHALRHSLSE